MKAVCSICAHVFDDEPPAFIGGYASEKVRSAVAIAGEIGKPVCRKWHSTRGLGCRESVGQPLGCPEGGLGIDGAVKLQGEW